MDPDLPPIDEEFTAEFPVVLPGRVWQHVVRALRAPMHSEADQGRNALLHAYTEISNTWKREHGRARA